VGFEQQAPGLTFDGSGGATTTAAPSSFGGSAPGAQAPSNPNVGFGGGTPGITFGGPGGAPQQAARQAAITGDPGNVSMGNTPSSFANNVGTTDAPAATGERKGLLSGLMNSEVAGTAIAGAAGGYLQGMGAKDAAEAKLERDRRAAQRTRANYGGGSGSKPGGLLRTDPQTAAAGQPRNAGAQTPAQQFAGGPQAGGGRYQYNRQSGQIEFIPSA
jgi:hypothetical protein